MRDRSTLLASFVAELRRRHVFRTLIGYGAVAFVVLQAAEIVLPAFGVADQILQLIVVLAVLGLPVVLALAWVYEITPGGIRTMKELDLEAGRKLEEEGSLFPRVALLAVTVLAAGTAGAYWVRTAMPAAGAGAADPTGPAASPAFRSADDGARDVPIRSVAVLPLESFSPPAAGESGAAEGDYFAAGMHEAIISRLSRVGGSFRVISRTTVQQFDPSGRSVAQIGEALGVEGIVEGSVVLDGGRVRITVQLIHAPSDTHLWSADYERELGDVIALQREVADAIAAEIAGELGQAPPIDVAAADASPSGAADPDAAVAEMKGRVALSEAGDGDDLGVQEAVRHFDQALRQDSTYVPALVGLAGSTFMRELSTGEGVSEEMLARIGSQVERALQLDPTSEEARDILTLVRSMEEGVPPAPRVPAPGRTPDRRVAATPPVSPSPHVRTDLGARLMALGATGFDRAAVPDIRLDAARTLVSVGRMDEAVRLLRRSVGEDPAHEATWDELEHVLVITERPSEAVAARRDRDRAGVATAGPGVDRLAEAVERNGARGYWEWRLDELAAREQAGRAVDPLARGRALAALGRGDEALAQLRAAAADGHPALVTLRSDPVWDRWRGDPRFRGVLGRLGRGDRGG